MSTKKSIEAAMMRHHQKQLARENNLGPSRRNKAPERDTQTEVLRWGRSNNFFLHVVEASVYDRVTGQRGEAKAEAGFPDVTGNTPTGLSCYIELKAKDRRSTVSELQRRFLTLKIEQNCFAVVVDSADRLAQYWKGFASLKTEVERRAYLKDCLPKQVQRKGAGDSFSQKYGF